MNSKKNLSKLNRPKSHRNSLRRNLLNSLVLYEYMTTTKAKSKLVLAEFDRVINIAKGPDRFLAERRLREMLFDKSAVLKAVEVLAKRFEKENNGFVKAYKLGRRKGDNAEMVKLMVKGYMHKDIGKKTTTKKAKKVTKQDSVAKAPQMDSNSNKSRSQVSAKGMQGKSKSRSGI